MGLLYVFVCDVCGLEDRVHNENEHQGKGWAMVQLRIDGMLTQSPFRMVCSRPCAAEALRSAIDVLGDASRTEPERPTGKRPIPGSGTP